MIPHVVEAKHIQGHRVWLKFDDGACGEVDLSDELSGPIFEPLKRVECFRQFITLFPGKTVLTSPLSSSVQCLAGKTFKRTAQPRMLSMLQTRNARPLNLE